MEQCYWCTTIINCRKLILNRSVDPIFRRVYERLLRDFANLSSLRHQRKRYTQKAYIRQPAWSHPFAVAANCFFFRQFGLLKEQWSNCSINLWLPPRVLLMMPPTLTPQRRATRRTQRISSRRRRHNKQWHHQRWIRSNHLCNFGLLE